MKVKSCPFCKKKHFTKEEAVQCGLMLSNKVALDRSDSIIRALIGLIKEYRFYRYFKKLPEEEK